MCQRGHRPGSCTVARRAARVETPRPSTLPIAPTSNPCVLLHHLIPQRMSFQLKDLGVNHCTVPTTALHRTHKVPVSVHFIFRKSKEINECTPPAAETAVPLDPTPPMLSPPSPTRHPHPRCPPPHSPAPPPSHLRVLKIPRRAVV